MHSTDGVEVSYQAPDTFVIPGGWEGTWEVTSPLRKHFVVKASEDLWDEE